MKATIQRDGQLAVPPRLQRRLGWSAGTVVILEVADGRLIGEKAGGDDPVDRWRGRGALPKGLTVDSYLQRVRG